MKRLTPYIAMTALAAVAATSSVASANDRRGHQHAHDDECEHRRVRDDRRGYDDRRELTYRYPTTYDGGYYDDRGHPGHADRYYDAIAAADYVARRLDRQRRRIDRARRAGMLHPHRARKLFRQNRKLERRFAKLGADRYLAPGELRHMTRKLDRASRGIQSSIRKYKYKRARRHKRGRGHWARVAYLRPQPRAASVGTARIGGRLLR